MEHQPQYQQNQQQSTNEDGICGSAKGGYLCRQSSTRWTPTTDQIRILKDLYYNSGVRSPSAEQIQRISARLRQYGKIEGKNVFYWFQNHKARERQKKRFTSDVPMHKGGNVSWKPDESIHKYSHTSAGVSSAPSSSAGMGNVGQIGTYGCGSATMEKSFRNCSISAADSNGNIGGALGHGWGLVGADPYSHATYTLIDQRRPTYERTMEDDQEDEAGPEIETLPLFPMHGDDFHGYCQLQPDSVYSAYYGGWYRSTEDGNHNISRTSLELSLNSYGRRSPNSA